jgi:excinuclease UvrABC nuclease subunit
MREAWKSLPFILSLAYLVPDKSGVYAVLRTKRVLGLPTSVEVLYVGKSRRLRGRFKQHAKPWTEHNPKLDNRNYPGDWEFWFRAMPREELDAAERDLIRQTGPAANIIRYGRGEKHG